MKKILKTIAKFMGLDISNLKAAQKLRSEYASVKAEKAEIETMLNKILFVLTNRASNKSSLEDFIVYSAGKLKLSRSQIFQDLFVSYLFKEKQRGFFVDFGATDGISLSNSYLLEKKYNWKGILAEPAKVWEDKLKSNRNCFIDTRCVWSKSGENVTFLETSYPELSTINDFSGLDYHAEKRKDSKTYTVETVSLNDLLKFYNAPSIIDYLSIDTEGSEFNILNAFDFKNFRIEVITVEHNFSEKRDDILKLLTSNGYIRIFEEISMFDDWYIQSSLQSAIFSTPK